MERLTIDEKLPAPGANGNGALVRQVESEKGKWFQPSSAPKPSPAESEQSFSSSGPWRCASTPIPDLQHSEPSLVLGVSAPARARVCVGEIVFAAKLQT